MASSRSTDQTNVPWYWGLSVRKAHSSPRLHAGIIPVGCDVAGGFDCAAVIVATGGLRSFRRLACSILAFLRHSLSAATSVVLLIHMYQIWPSVSIRSKRIVGKWSHFCHRSYAK